MNQHKKAFLNKITSFLEVDYNILENDTLVVFDVDDVLTVPNATTGMYGEYKNKWGEIINEYKRKSPDFSKNLEYYLSILYSQQEEIILDPSIYKVLHSLKLKNIPTIACSSWKTGKFGIIENMAEHRYKVLKDLNIMFDWSYYNIKLNLLVDGTDKKPAFSKGVICTDGANKGGVLLAFFNQIKYKPKNLIFFDDSLKNMNDVKNMCEKNNINFIGYHYIKSIPSNWNEKLVRFKIENLIKHNIWYKNDEIALFHFKKNKNHN
ncbi:DUF2608 domain-containing protein [Rickettsiales endosymbiont of Stachyamoeba lipophora]|uniref:DUF2608 domain-containing protein n=1 Tax=Rickettsiales endosymbiont of Stachyamoeba lipophora TaxID=2486578 RepID=UPI0013DDB618|nr:DUF2608 domain-containing protein [Rickettsiales endosymbiont of Stachyamoeba lipophora]